MATATRVVVYGMYPQFPYHTQSHTKALISAALEQFRSDWIKIIKSDQGKGLFIRFSSRYVSCLHIALNSKSPSRTSYYKSVPENTLAAAIESSYGLIGYQDMRRSLWHKVL